MGILQLLAKENYIAYHKTLAKLVGVDEAILFGELCSMCNLYGNEFFCEQSKLMNDTCLTEYRVRNALKNLQKAELVSIVKKGLPAKNHYTLDENKLLELLDRHRTSAVKIDTTGNGNFNGTGSDKSGSTFIKNTGSKNTGSKNTGKRERKPFIPPTLEEVQAYCKERNNNVNAKKFFDYFDAADWIDSKGSPVRNWKQKVITWESYASNDKQGRNGKDGQNAGDSSKTKYSHVV